MITLRLVMKAIDDAAKEEASHSGYYFAHLFQQAIAEALEEEEKKGERLMKEWIEKVGS